MTFVFGHILDIPDPRDRDALGLFAVAPALPPVDLRAHVQRIRNQGAVGSCVAEAFVAAIEIRSSVLGRHVPELSPLAVYAIARRGDPVLLDEGCRPRDCASGLSDYGAVPEERWPYREILANTRVPMDVLQHGADARISGYYRVGGDGADRCAGVQAALAKGFPVPMAQVVEQSFMDYQPGQILGPLSGPALGGHMTTILSYDAATDSYLVLNQYGIGWGDGGFYRMSGARLASPFVSDCYVVTLDGDDPRAT